MTASISQTGPAVIRLNFLAGLVSLPNALSIGAVTTGPAGSAASATVTGAAPAQVLNLTIPKGDQGLQGNASTVPGPPNTLAIGTVTTGAAGTSAAATITGSAPTQTLNLTIPKGVDGSGSVSSVAGRTGAVTLTAGDVAGALTAPVSNASLANSAAGTVKANLTGASAAPSDVALTALLAALVPATSVKTASWTVAASDLMRRFVFSGTADATLTLPAGASVPPGFSFLVKHVGSSFVLTLTPNGADTIDVSALLAQEGAEIFWDGSVWRVFGLQARTLLVPTTSVATSTSLTVVLPTGYSGFEFELHDLTVTGAAALLASLSQDAGATFPSASGTFISGEVYATAAGPAADAGSSVAYISLTLSLVAGSMYPALSTLKLYPGDVSLTPSFRVDNMSRYSGQGFSVLTQGGVRDNVGRASHLRFLPSTANSVAWKYRMWGIR